MPGQVPVTGTFTLTFDTELIWGSFDSKSPREFERLYPDIRGTIDRLLALLDRHEVSATWAVLGHLFLSECSRGDGGLAHPELVHPRQSWRPGDWYASDPCTDRRKDPLWYGDDIVDALLAARIQQDIGSHSFGHALYGDEAMTRAAVDADLDACLTLAAERGIELRSFVFPRNSEGHHEALRAHGFTAFRGMDPTWHVGLPGLLSRAGHLVDQGIGLAPPVSKPYEKLPGLWNIPGSALVMDRTGGRRAISMAARVRKAQAGLQRAAETGGVFHLWTHPFNIASDPDFLLATIEAVVSDARAARDRGEIAIESMAVTAARLSASPPGE
jgi:peptidoglycan/xylan/chitin deacetylase (PgdA/CDA1 family)